MEEYLSYDTISYDKERRLTTLLGLIAIPTRQSLTDDLVRIVSDIEWNLS